MSRPLSILLFLSMIACLPLSAQLNVDFSADRLGGCSPLIIKFSNLTTGASGAATYQWDLGNGNVTAAGTGGAGGTAAAAGTQAVYTDEGSYTVTLTVNDGGNTLTATHVVTVYPRPKPVFSFTPGSVCGPQAISFTGTGQGTITNWLWDFGDGSTTQTSSPTAKHAYPNSVHVRVNLTATNNYGCTDTVSSPVAITVLTPATSAFTADKRVLCLATDPVQFTSNSSGPGPLTYFWDFGDGTSSTLTNPPHSYSANGSYTVKLTTTTVEGCSATSTQTNFLNVANYSTDFDLPASLCQFSVTQIDDKSIPTADSRVWAVDGATVTVANPLNYLAVVPGAHTMTLTNQFGSCPQSVSKTFTIMAAPIPVAFDKTIVQSCDHITVTLTDHTPDAVSWNWNWGAGSPLQSTQTLTQDFLYDQTYYIALTVTNSAGCTTTDYGQIFVSKPVIAIYEPTANSNISCQLPITKTYAIQNQAALASWHWDFGDGSTSTDPNPTHTFTGPGSFTPTLYYTDVTGCTSSVSYTTVTISDPFTLDFSAVSTTVCVGTGAVFTSPSLDAAKPTAVRWDFGDGNSSDLSYYAYNSTGTFTVTLTAQNAGGCSATVTKTDYITVLAPPGQYQSYTNTCVGDRGQVTFYISPGTATSQVWDFGDGQTATTSGSTTSVVHEYASTGTYFPEITVNNSVCTKVFSDRVYVLKKQNPVLSASSAVACIGGTLEVQLQIERNPREINSGFYDDYTPTFSYSDGTPFTGTIGFTTLSQSYSNGAFHWVLSGFTPGKSGLQVTTQSFGFGCTDVSNVIPLTVRGAATAALTVVSDDHCYLSPVLLQDGSTPGANNSIVSELWQFGDGQVLSSTNTGAALSHSYSAPGQYTVNLSVTDAGGCTTTTGSNTTVVTVNGPAAAFTPSGVNVNLNTTVSFFNSTNYYGCSNVVWAWDFGDGSVAGDYSPSHTYTAPGVYTVTLVARDASNPNTCVSRASATITVKNFNSHFSTSTSYVGTAGCPPVLAQFYNTSSNYSSVSWDFGDGFMAGNVNSPSHVYQQAGRYIVTLNVKGFNGLTSSYIDSVFVRAPSAAFSASKATVCQGQAESYLATATAAKQYTWDFGDGSVGSGSYPDSVIDHNYADAGNFVARLIVTDTFGCPMAATPALNVVVDALPKLSFTPDAPFVCFGGTAMLGVSGAKTYSWSPATGLDRTDVSGPVAGPLSTTTYTVLATDDAGCQSTGHITVDVQAHQQVAVDPDSTSICDGKAVQMQVSGADRYRWLGDVQGTDVFGTVTAKPTETSIYTVIGTDSHSCFSDTATVIVTVLPAPTVDGGPDVEVIAGSPVLLPATGSADVIKWEWTPPDYLSCSDCAQPVSSPRKPETYLVTVTNAVGCSATDTVVAKILCEESRVRMPDAFSPNGDGKNDRFVILGIGFVRHLVIYSRWGVKVWERNNFYPADAASCWDGMVNGQPAPVGAYAYYVEMECPTGGVFGRTGTVVVVR